MDDIPANSGRFPVGCTDFMTERNFRPSGDTNESNIPGYFMRLFYPTKPEAEKSYERAKWIPSKIYSDGFASFVHLPVWLFGRFTKWFLGKLII